MADSAAGFVAGQVLAAASRASETREISQALQVAQPLTAAVKRIPDGLAAFGLSGAQSLLGQAVSMPTSMAVPTLAKAASHPTRPSVATPGFVS